MVKPDPIPFDLLEIEIVAQTKPTKALQAAQELADTNPDDPEVLNKLASYQIEAGLLDKAQSNLENSLAIDESKPETLIYLGMIARQKGQLDQAIAHLSQAIKMTPVRWMLILKWDKVIRTVAKFQRDQDLP